LVRLRHSYVGVNVMITGPGHRPSLEAPTSVVDLFASCNAGASRPISISFSRALLPHSTWEVL
jgi:hypothetical protein